MKKIINIICLLVIVSWLLPPIASASLIDDLQEQIRQKEEEIKQLEQQAATYKKELETTQSQKNTLNNQLTTIASRIKKLQNDISITSTKISSTTLQIEGLSLDIGEKQDEIDKKKQEISIMIQALYEYDQESLIETILMKNSLSDFVNQVHYLETLQENVHKNMLVLQELKKNMEQEKAAAEYQRTQLAGLNNQLRSQKQIVDSEKQEKNYLLVQTKGQEKQYQSLLNETLRKQQEIEQQIFDLEDKIKLTLDPSSMPEARPGVLSWPLDGVLTQIYGYTAYSKNLYKTGFHNGIDIASSYGEAIRAARDGKIIGIGNCGKYAYGKWILIEHDNKLTTLYGHFSNYGVFKVGDSIKRGDIIGYEGSTGYSTGPHLHFGVYASETIQIQKVWYGTVPIGAHLDPQKYL